MATHPPFSLEQELCILLCSFIFAGSSSPQELARTMFLLKIFGGLWRKRRVGIEQSACCYPGEKEMTRNSDRIRKPRPWRSTQPVSKCYGTRPVGWDGNPNILSLGIPTSQFSFLSIFSYRVHRQKHIQAIQTPEDRSHNCHSCTPPWA